MNPSTETPKPADTTPSFKLPAATDKTVWRATGRRKTAVARILMKRGTGAFMINGKEADKYFSTEVDRTFIRAPLRLTKTQDAFDLRVNVQGGGTTGQAGAVVLGVSRVLKRIIPVSDPFLRAENFLTRDSREKERRKYGHKKARRSFQWTKR